MTIKKGDKIKLKKNAIYNSHSIDELTIRKLSNRILTVSEVYIDCIKILEDEIGYYWFRDMFDKIYVESYIKEIKTKKNNIKSIVVEIKMF